MHVRQKFFAKSLNPADHLLIREDQLSSEGPSPFSFSWRVLGRSRLALGANAAPASLSIGIPEARDICAHTNGSFPGTQPVIRPHSGDPVAKTRSGNCQNRPSCFTRETFPDVSESLPSHRRDARTSICRLLEQRFRALLQVPLAE